MLPKGVSCGSLNGKTARDWVFGSLQLHAKFIARDLNKYPTERSCYKLRMKISGGLVKFSYDIYIGFSFSGNLARLFFLLFNHNF